MKVEIIKQNVGVDVSKDDIKVAFSILSADYRVVVRSTRTFANTRSGFKQLQEWINAKKHPVPAIRFTMEATGVYYEGLAYFLYEHNYGIHVVLPNLGKKYAQSLGIKSKTDKLDARALAQMGLERELRLPRQYEITRSFTAFYKLVFCDFVKKSQKVATFIVLLVPKR